MIGATTSNGGVQNVVAQFIGLIMTLRALGVTNHIYYSALTISDFCGIIFARDNLSLLYNDLFL